MAKEKALEIMDISTHTLTWSVTMGQVVVITGKRGISTHTLTWSVTKFDNYLDMFSLFQLTRSRGA